MSFKMSSELYPLFAVLGAGVALAGYAGFRNLSSHNDIVINKGEPYQFQTKESPKFFNREKTIKEYQEKHPEIKKATN